MMLRDDIVNKIGNKYLTVNLESEFSYSQAGVCMNEIPQDSSGTKNYKLDIRFEDTSSNTSILVETNSTANSQKNRKLHIEKLLNSYCFLETKIRPNNNIILIFAESGISNELKVWKKKCNCEIEELTDTTIKTMKEYVEYFKNDTVNNEIELRQSVYLLNEKLHTAGIPEDIRGQFVGTCLLALKANETNPNSFSYKNCSTSQIIAGIKTIIGSLLNNDMNRADKIALLDTKVLQQQNVRTLETTKFQDILEFICFHIIPHININTSRGQDLLNLFFTTFNKYVGKKDKNQAFTPDHITHFMCKVAEVNKYTKVLDPTCGSGSFIVQSLIQELYDCETDEERENVKKNNIYGIEVEEKAYGLSTTNMLIHGDGNSNVRMDEKKGCFGLRDWIQENNIDVVLMNPPYNAIPSKIPAVIKDKSGKLIYTIHEDNNTWKTGKTDPTKGFCFVNYIADCVGKNKEGKVRTGKKLLCLLPLSCAIGSDKKIQKEKIKILENNTLEAVFSLPSEMFYPGANVNACCMVFTLGQSHFTRDENNNLIPRKSTFFGYYKDDGFIKKKNLGRVTKSDVNNQPIWNHIENLWLNLYHGEEKNEYLGIRKKVNANDEWLAEAYIKTDYSKLLETDFQKTINKYFAYLVGNGYNFYNKVKPTERHWSHKSLNLTNWKEYKISDLFHISLSKGDIKEGDCSSGNIPLISSGTLNNGVIEYIDEEGDGIAEKFSKNKITVDMFGQAFYQPEDFYSVSHGRVNILSCNYPQFNKFQGLFICSIINNEKYRFSYNRAVYSGVIANLTIKLPSKDIEDKTNTVTGYEPDWSFMEEYIKSLPYSDLI